jgi:hypothetical protein
LNFCGKLKEEEKEKEKENTTTTKKKRKHGTRPILHYFVKLS